MFVGIDVCHSINNHKKPSVFGISNSLDAELKDWTSEHLILDKYLVKSMQYVTRITTLHDKNFIYILIDDMYDIHFYTKIETTGNAHQIFKIIQKK
jgi:hypothetical protein